jgi:hypothetical protein
MSMVRPAFGLRNGRLASPPSQALDSVTRRLEKVAEQLEQGGSVATAPRWDPA